MRPPRPGLSWSRDRLSRRDAYAHWMASAGWQQVRRAWLGAHRARCGTEPTCQACGGPWSLGRDDLHHRCYDRLGHERQDDLVPLHRACHDHLHRVLESAPAWRRMDRAQASDLILTGLRRSRPGPDRPCTEGRGYGDGR
ncbi:MAG: hypothetical protein ACRDZQ_04615 [Acidimicrobiales bacterium]